MAGLVVSRFIGEEVVIGDNIIVRVVDIRGCEKVRLQFEAPREVQIHRREVYEAIKREGLKRKEAPDGD